MKSLEGRDRPGPAILVIMGGGGDLTWRKLVPALDGLFERGWLPEKLAIIGVDQKAMIDEEYRKRLKDGVERFRPPSGSEAGSWNGFADCVSYLNMDFTGGGRYEDVRQRIEETEKRWDAEANRIFYLAVPPSLIEPIVGGLDDAGLTGPRERSRVVVEKPFGWDLDSARELNGKIGKVFQECQIFRIDHYLGKETVQNILAFRFANSLFEPIWDRRYIDHVQITVAEEVGVGHRGGYYEKAGALRDMVQNHLFQVFTLIAMEPPVSFDADEIRGKKVDVLRAVRPIPPDRVHDFAARGQYGAGWMQGEHVRGYRDEEAVSRKSKTETFAALKLFVDNWRWQGVPFYLRTGKRLPARISTASIHFRPVPHQAFPPRALGEMQANHLVITFQPDEAIGLRFLVRRPELGIRLSTAEMRFSYEEAFHAATPEAYEQLLLDVMRGDATLFKRAEQVEWAWSVVAPVLDGWAENPPPDFPNYAAGTWGPAGADALIAGDGRQWLSAQA